MRILLGEGHLIADGAAPTRSVKRRGTRFDGRSFTVVRRPRRQILLLAISRNASRTPARAS